MEAGDRYVSYLALEKPQKDIKDIVLMLLSDDWQMNFDSVTELRGFMKFNWEEFSHYFGYLRPRIMNLAFSIRSSLAKNTLMLLSELFSTTREGMIPSDILDTLLSKSSSEKSFLKSEILTAIQNICDNFISFEIFEVILSSSFSKSTSVSKTSLHYLSSLLLKMPLESKFEALPLLEEGKRCEHQVIAKKILTELDLTMADFREKVKTLPEKSQKWIQSLVSSKSIQKPSLKEIIKQNKANKENFEVILNE